MPRVLAYNIRGVKADLIKMHCHEAGVEYFEVSPADYAKPIETLLDRLAAFADAVDDTFTDEMLLFYGVDDDVLHPLLAKIRQTGGVELKAVVTKFNRRWSSLQLRDELLRERDAMMKTLAGNK